MVTSGMPRITQAAVLMSLVGTVLNLLLAIFLLICGIFVLRQSDKGAKLHWIYVALKIPAAMLAAGGMWWMWSQLLTSMPTGAVKAVTWVSLVAIIPAALGCIYPLKLIFVLRSRSVRAYYNSVYGS